jgi:chemotaxis protein methyltransferase WspC
MDQSAIETLIKQKTGLDAAIMGSGSITSAINRRQRCLNITNLQTYYSHLQQNPTELQSLIETVVIPETWFFRDRIPFQFLTQHIQQAIKHRKSPLRILTVPCSTGEEPYSIAMALLNAGVSSQQFQIDALDISEQNIQQAKAGIYSRFSFRNGEASIQQQFFMQQGDDDRFAIHDRIKQTVHFQSGNILTIKLPKQNYDVIFCRNLLIYFDHPTRQKVLKLCQKMLTPQGILFVGHAESGVLLNQGWRSLRVPFAFAYRLPEGLAPRVASVPTRKEQALERSLTRSTQAQILGPRPQPKAPEPTAVEARELADQGDLDQATALCLVTLAKNPLDIDTNLLLGELYQAQDQTQQAEKCFAKVIYLQPNSVEALTYLARLREEKGDRTGADLLYDRIRRIS